MKTIQKLTLVALFIACNVWVGYAQFVGTNATTQTPISEVRKGTTVEYSVVTGHSAGDEYSWEITGGMPNPAPSGGTGVAGDPYIVNFTANQHTINVQWAADDNTATSLTGRVRVQKRNSGGCVSVIQDLRVDRWSLATAAISGPLTTTICNGSPLNIPIVFTGAPNFDLDYAIVSTLTGASVTTSGTLTGIAAGTANISIPAADLVNTTNANQTYTVTLSRMNDSFTGNGTIGVANTFTITVSAPAATGEITVSPASLTRRP